MVLKMILVDSLYINDSGGFQLLKYLILSLIERKLDFILLADLRCEGKFDNCNSVIYMKASLLERKRFYSLHSDSFSSVLCFGNIPAPIRLKVPTFTYFHNINYLTLKGLPSKRVVALSWAKREVYRHYKHNTDYWVVQSTNTKNELVHYLGVEEYKVLIKPFFYLPDSLKKLANSSHGNDYVYVANYTGSKQHEELLIAWELLHERKIDKVLHLTVPNTKKEFLEKVVAAQKRGVMVVNHGFVPFEEVINLYAQSKAIVYPSLNESLGLGIVEAIEAGCDVIGSDLPFIHSICKPSQVFNPYSATSIADAVAKYEKGECVKSELTIINHIDDLIELVSR